MLLEHGDTALFNLDGSDPFTPSSGKNRGVVIMCKNGAYIVPFNTDGGGGVEISGYIAKASGDNADMTAAYASATTITISDLPADIEAINADDIMAIAQYATDGSLTKIHTRKDDTITCSGTDPTTVTVAGAEFVNTDTFVVYTNIQRRLEILGYDRTQNAVHVKDPNPFAAGHICHHATDVTLDDDPTTDTSAPIYIGDCDKVSFLIKSDVTIVGAAPQVTYTIEVADVDETEYIPVDVIMTDDGEDAPVASIVHDADTEEVAYLPDGFTASYMKVVSTGANTDTDDTVACDVYVELKKG